MAQRASSSRGGTRRRWRSEDLGTVGLGAVVAVVAAGMFIGDGYDYDAVCADTATNRRVPDEQCSSTGHAAAGAGSRWYYVPAGRQAPAVGGPVGNGTFTAPDGTRFTVHRGGVSAHGGTVSRGGFGGRLGTVGG